MGNVDQVAQMQKGAGFIAALDQSGGSTPKALKQYGVDESAYRSEAEMFDLIHAMRTRIATAPAFTGKKVIGAILFEMTMDREIDGAPAAEYLWAKRGVVPFLKIDKGLEAEADGVQMLKPMPDLDATLDRAAGKGIFGSKARSVIAKPNAQGINANVAQQFEVGAQVLDHGLVPIIEPEVLINAPSKAEAEQLLRDALLNELDRMSGDRQVMLKLTLPEEPDFYAPVIAHPKVMRVVALSGGYSRDEATGKLAANHGMIASFSRALTEGLSAQQDEAAFNARLEDAITKIHAASVT
ncbi:fructose bisphosphate aldolase [Gymnodinialimonas ceratoperidinii]|uniref:Fructose bisphosphate aldolase n=1 Tax=Gymnodinialimonas ceratoperidinii TaxID=2856823 RepID=A0A8F6TUA6_9RHOB|nr:fructose bisphosphate aldolase [Gymnodinialimonas ceratoperidinii]QXT38840.1 fructose bisphosphate aldolase [Gymnodinialimonas ceratoperidinii]